MAASGNLSNEEIRQKLINLGFNSGPVTDTTRGIYLKKLEELKNQNERKCRKIPVNNEASVDTMTDEELRLQLLAYGQSVAPITTVNRDIYKKRLVKLRSENCKNNNRRGRNSVGGSEDWDESEPMEID